MVKKDFSKQIKTLNLSTQALIKCQTLPIRSESSFATRRTGKKHGTFLDYWTSLKTYSTNWNSLVILCNTSWRNFETSVVKRSVKTFGVVMSDESVVLQRGKF